MANVLRDGNILRDFAVFIEGYGMVGTCPSFQPPEMKIQVEEFRGGGMDGVVEVPMGIEKIEFDFDLHVWDDTVFSHFGFGPGRQDRVFIFRGYLLSPQGTERPALITTNGFVRDIKPGKVEPGKKSEHTISFSAYFYQLQIDGTVILEADLYTKTYITGGAGGEGDVQVGARGIIGFDMGG